MNTVELNINGQICAVPIEDLNNPRKMQWWLSIGSFGDDPKIEALAIKGWQRYAKIRPPNYWELLKMHYAELWRRFLWDRPHIMAIVYNLKYPSLGFRSCRSFVLR